jgi:hypothetical protein
MDRRKIRSGGLVVAALVAVMLTAGVGTAQSRAPGSTRPFGTSPGGEQLAAHLAANPNLGLI